MEFLNLYLGTKSKSGKVFSILKLVKNQWKTNIEESDELCLNALTPESLRNTFVSFVRSYLFPEGNAYMYLIEDENKVHVSGIVSFLSHTTPLNIREMDSETLPHIRGIEKNDPNRILTYDKRTNSIYFAGLNTPALPAPVVFNLSWANYLASQGYFIPTTPLTPESLLQPFEVAANDTEEPLLPDTE